MWGEPVITGYCHVRTTIFSMTNQPHWLNLSA